MFFNLNQVCIKDNFITTIINVIVFGSNIVNRNCTELCFNNHVGINNRSSSNLRITTLNYPFFKHLARNERILWHGPNSLSSSSIVLREAFRLCTIIVQDDKSDIEIILELSLNGEI